MCFLHSKFILHYFFFFELFKKKQTNTVLVCLRNLNGIVFNGTWQTLPLGGGGKAASYMIEGSLPRTGCLR